MHADFRGNLVGRFPHAANNTAYFKQATGRCHEVGGVRCASVYVLIPRSSVRRCSCLPETPRRKPRKPPPPAQFCSASPSLCVEPGAIKTPNIPSALRSMLSFFVRRHGHLLCSLSIRPSALNTPMLGRISAKPIVRPVRPRIISFAVLLCMTCVLQLN